MEKGDKLFNTHTSNHPSITILGAEEEGKLQSRGGAISRELSDVKKPDILLLDSLVSRIEHLSSDVQNMDNKCKLMHA